MPLAALPPKAPRPMTLSQKTRAVCDLYPRREDARLWHPTRVEAKQR